MSNVASKLAQARQLFESGRAEQARAGLLVALRQHPGDPALSNALAVVLGAMGQHDQAIFHAERAAAGMPGHPAPLVNLGNSLAAVGRDEEALGTFRQILTRAPQIVEARLGVANLLRRRGEHVAAIPVLEAGLAQQPSSDLCALLGEILLDLGRLDDAEPMASRAVALDGRNPDARIALAKVLRARGRHLEALRTAEEGLAHRPGELLLLHIVVGTLPMLGRTEEAVAMASQALAHVPGDLNLATGRASFLNYVPGASPAEVLEAHRHCARLIEAGVKPLPPPPAPSGPERRLRLGILSYDLRRHSVAFFLEPILQHLDRGGFDIFCYSTAPIEDDVTARLRGLAGHWQPAVGPDDRRLAEQIRSDGIDVLIETSGYTYGHRLPVMAMRPAPLQATFLGYANTTGLSAIDLRIVDSITDPPGAEVRSTERLVRLDPCFLCYQPPAEVPDVQQAPVSRGEAPVFGCFSSLQKISSEVIQTWAELLSEVPGSRLLLKPSELREPEVHAQVESRLRDAGVDLARVELMSRTDRLRDHLAAYGRMDIALDTFPYNGTTTIFESLWMGVPTVTLRGEVHAARVGASILTALGITEHIATTPKQYISRAAALARDTEALIRLRTELRQRLAASPLCDGAAYAARFGAVIRHAWRSACQPENKPL
jgi:protein O-GlcNAc transferase